VNQCSATGCTNPAQPNSAATRHQRPATKTGNALPKAAYTRLCMVFGLVVRNDHCAKHSVNMFGHIGPTFGGANASGAKSAERSAFDRWVSPYGGVLPCVCGWVKRLITNNGNRCFIFFRSFVFSAYERQKIQAFVSNSQLYLAIFSHALGSDFRFVCKWKEI
jgi:hypothetical protein